MNTDFGIAEKQTSKCRKRAVHIFRSNRFAGKVIQYSYSDSSKSDKTIEFFTCKRCREINEKATEKRKLPRVTIANGRFKSDPDNTTNEHFCYPANDPNASIGAVLGKRKIYDVRDEICKTKRKPKVQFDETLKAIHTEFRNETSETRGEFK